MAIDEIPGSSKNDACFDRRLGAVFTQELGRLIGTK